MTVWEAVIKIDTATDHARQARDISDGIGYACALLMDEFNWSPEDVERRLDAIVNDAYDHGS